MTREECREGTVRPNLCSLEEDRHGKEGESEDEEEGVMKTEDPTKVDADKDRKFVRMLADPKLPSEEERRMHWLQGHYPYRGLGGGRFRIVGTARLSTSKCT